MTSQSDAEKVRAAVKTRLFKEYKEIVKEMVDNELESFPVPYYSDILREIFEENGFRVTREGLGFGVGMVVEASITPLQKPERVTLSNAVSGMLEELAQTPTMR